MARRVTISTTDEARLVFDRGQISSDYGQETDIFGPFLFNHLDYICYLYHKSPVCPSIEVKYF